MSISTPSIVYLPLAAASVLQVVILQKNLFHRADNGCRQPVVSLRVVVVEQTFNSSVLPGNT